MSGANFTLQLQYPVAAGRLYEQFATQQGIHNWWTDFCAMEERVGGQASFRFPKAGFSATVRILRLEPNRCVEWECTDQTHPVATGFSDLHDWVGTKIRFEIAETAKDRSTLTFTHAGLAPLECADMCSSAWSFFLNQSLRGYLERGKGQPDLE